MQPTVTKVAFGAALLLAGVGLAQDAPEIPIGGIVYNYVGHIYVNPLTGSGEVAGYFSSIVGIDKPFQGAPSEATATSRIDPTH